MGKTGVVVNPASANGKTAKRWPGIEELLRREGFEFEVRFTAGPGDATVLARRFLQEGCDLVVSVGGDGTHNEVINGFFDEQGRPAAEAAVGIIPTGTGGDLVRTLGIPREPEAAVKHLAASDPRPVDAGRISFVDHGGAPQTRYFINIAGLGLDGDTVQRVNRTSKALGGFVSFLWGTVTSLILYRNRVMEVTVDGKVVCNGPLTVITMANGQYFGGGMRIAPHAVMNDGLLDIVMLHGMGKLELLLNLPRVYKGTHLTHRRIETLRGRRVTVKSPEETLVDIDGEQPGRAPVEVELLPLALKVKG